MTSSLLSFFMLDEVTAVMIAPSCGCLVSSSRNLQTHRNVLVEEGGDEGGRMQVKVTADLLVLEAGPEQQGRRLDRAAGDDDGAAGMDEGLATVGRGHQGADALGPLAARRQLVHVLTRRHDVRLGRVGEEQPVDARALDELAAVLDRVLEPCRHTALLLAVRAAEAAVAAVVHATAGVLRLRL